MTSDFLIDVSSTIEKALASLDLVKGLGLIVVDSSGSFQGVITDGDIRRAISNGYSLHDGIDTIYNKNPIVADINTSSDELYKITKDRKIKLVPILDGKKVVNIYKAEDDFSRVSAVIMAGGLGTRLGEFTKECPKPMLEVGGKPILQRIIQNLVQVGIKKIYISVNYMAEVIENYFQDGSSLGCDIRYLKEPYRMGTAGSLSLLPDDVTGPIILTNGDLITLVDFRRLVTYHRQHKSLFTLCTRKYDVQIPFGVVETEDGMVKSIVEKPLQTFNVSAGVYVFDREILKHVPREQYYDMPTMIDNLMKSGVRIENFPLVEEWIDIGRVSDLQYARTVYKD